MNGLSKDAASFVTVGDDADGQRIDNFLLRILKGVPKSHVYRILRSGEVRLNKGRARPDARVAEGDVVRVPPIETEARTRNPAPLTRQPFRPAILYEDDAVIAVDKPSGLAVTAAAEFRLGLSSSCAARDLTHVFSNSCIDWTAKHRAFCSSRRNGRH